MTSHAPMSLECRLMSAALRPCIPQASLRSHTAYRLKLLTSVGCMFLLAANRALVHTRQATYMVAFSAMPGGLENWERLISQPLSGASQPTVVSPHSNVWNGNGQISAASLNCAVRPVRLLGVDQTVVDRWTLTAGVQLL